MQRIPNTLPAFLLLCILSINVKAQEVKITQVELQANGDVAVSYKLSDERPDKKYSLYLYTSGDNYIQPLEKVTGDVGVNLTLGEKKLIWHAKEELGASFKGGVSLELKGNTYVPFIALDGFEDYKVLKRGKEYDVTWTGGRGDNVLVFELYKGDNKVKVFEERPNVGNTVIVIPKDVKPGRYKFKISDNRNKDEVVYTMDFRVKRKIPLAFDIGVVALVGGAIVYLSGSGTKEEPKMGEPPLPNHD
jgi:hypothetical protein